MGSGGFEKVLIGTRGARETFLRGRKGRAAMPRTVKVNTRTIAAAATQFIGCDTSGMRVVRVVIYKVFVYFFFCSSFYIFCCTRFKFRVGTAYRLVTFF